MHALCFWKRFWEQLTVRLCIIAAVEAHHFSALVHTEPNRCKRGERFTSWRWRPHAFCVFLALIKVCVVSLPFLLPVGHFVGLWLPHCQQSYVFCSRLHNYIVTISKLDAVWLSFLERMLFSGGKFIEVLVCRADHRGDFFLYTLPDIVATTTQ